MAEAIQYLTYVNPLRYFLVIIRGIFLEGSTPAVLWPQMLALLTLGAVVSAAGTLRFRKRLEQWGMATLVADAPRRWDYIMGQRP